MFNMELPIREMLINIGFNDIYIK